MILRSLVIARLLVVPFLTSLLIAPALVAETASEEAPETTPAQDGEPLPDRAPVLLQARPMLPPPETAGSGLAPEVKIRIEIDERGNVTQADVEEVKPSTSYDPVFRRHTLAALDHYRYAPAIENGVPVARSLSWTVKYLPFHQAAAPVSMVEPAERSGGQEPLLSMQRFASESERLDDAFARHDRLLGMDLDERRNLLLKYAEDAEKWLRAESRRVAQTDNVRVVTDAESPEVAEILVRNIESTLATVHRILQPLEPYPRDLKTLVYIYRSEGAYRQLQAGLLIRTGSTGSYMPPGLLSFHQEVSSPVELLSVLIHEATHAYSDQHLARPGVRLPRWFEEGFAEYMGNSRIKGGKILPGKMTRRRLSVRHFGPSAWEGRSADPRQLRSLSSRSRVLAEPTEVGDALKKMKQQVDEGEILPLDRLLGLDRRAFYVEDPEGQTAASWLFMHFLRHGEDSWAEGPFSDMVLYLAEGFPSREAIETAYGLSLGEVEPRFHRYVLKL